MKISVSPLSLTKRYPLTISRGTSAGSENLLIEVAEDGIVGLGEMSPVSIGHEPETAAQMAVALDSWGDLLNTVAPWEMERVEEVLGNADGFGSARAALDMALYDWIGKSAGMPVYKLLGGDVNRIVPSSITVGINPPDVVRGRIPELVERLSPKTLKVKLGSPEGIAADKAMFEVVLEVTPKEIDLRVDANGGWSPETAPDMIIWLAERGVDYVEQPLPLGLEQHLRSLRRESPIPIFADESCRFASDVPKLAGSVDGVNLKLMKSGGIREGLRLIHTARAHGLKVMIGCMSESSLAIAAGVHLSTLVDYIDLDSHLNLLPDPFSGLLWQDGRVLPGGAPGLGVRLTD